MRSPFRTPGERPFYPAAPSRPKRARIQRAAPPIEPAPTPAPPRSGHGRAWLIAALVICMCTYSFADGVREAHRDSSATIALAPFLFVPVLVLSLDKGLAIQFQGTSTSRWLRWLMVAASAMLMVSLWVVVASG